MHAEPNKSHASATDLLNTVPSRLEPSTRPSRPGAGVDLLLDDIKAPKQPSAAVPAK